MRQLIPFSLVFVFIAVVAFVTKTKSPGPPATDSCNDYQWKGSVAIEELPADRNLYYLPEKLFIVNGAAQVRQEFSNYYRFWTNIELNIPCTKTISADNIKLEWYGKSNLSIGFDESDLGATIIGDKDTAGVNSITYFRPPYTVFRFGRKKLTSVPELVNDPSGWATYALEITGKTMKFYKNGTIKKQLKDNQALGILRKINIHFKGSGRVDWVKLYEHNTLVMQEDFNTKGKSTIKWMQ